MRNKKGRKEKEKGRLSTKRLKAETKQGRNKRRK